MSKKKFTAGLEDLFDMAIGDNLQEDSPLLTETKTRQKKSKKTSGRTSGKSFASDLESLFTGSGNSSSDNEAKQNERSEAYGARGRRIPRKSVGGSLDALIRQTTNASRVEIESTSKKRVTFIFDKSKFGKLKTIARSEKAYIKDIIGGILSEYISRYENENGEVDEVRIKAE